MVTLVNYSDASMTKSQQVCTESSLANGVDNVFAYNADVISKEFKSFNSSIFNEGGRGASCFWLFKPYIIYKALVDLSLKENDVLIYSDVGIKWISNVNEIISRMDQDIFLFSNGHQHVHWTKADILKAILHVDMISDHYQQVQASVIFLKVNDYTRRFIKEWLLFCQLPGLIDDTPSKLPNHPEFAEARHDQSILGTMAIRDNLTLHWWPDKLWYESQKYRWPEDTYPAMFEHHRKRNKGMGGGIDPEWT